MSAGLHIPVYYMQLGMGNQLLILYMAVPFLQPCCFGSEYRMKSTSAINLCTYYRKYKRFPYQNPCPNEKWMCNYAPFPAIQMHCLTLQAKNSVKVVQVSNRSHEKCTTNHHLCGVEKGHRRTMVFFGYKHCNALSSVVSLSLNANKKIISNHGYCVSARLEKVIIGLLRKVETVGLGDLYLKNVPR